MKLTINKKSYNKYISIEFLHEMGQIQSSYDSEKKIWSGAVSEPVYDFNYSIGKIIHSSLKNYKDNVVQVGVISIVILRF